MNKKQKQLRESIRRALSEQMMQGIADEEGNIASDLEPEEIEAATDAAERRPDEERFGNAPESYMAPVRPEIARETSEVGTRADPFTGVQTGHSGQDIAVRRPGSSSHEEGAWEETWEDYRETLPHLPGGAMEDQPDYPGEEDAYTPDYDEDYIDEYYGDTDNDLYRLGTTLRAPATMEVLEVGDRGGWGNRVVVRFYDTDTDQWYHASFNHLESIPDVEVGQMIEAGQPIGTNNPAVIGNTGRSTGPHLHHSVWTQPEGWQHGDRASEYTRGVQRLSWTDWVRAKQAAQQAPTNLPPEAQTNLPSDAPMERLPINESSIRSATATLQESTRQRFKILAGIRKK